MTATTTTTTVRVFVVSAILALVLGLVAVIWWDSTRPVMVVVTGNPDATIVVQMEGAVASPGVVTLPAGSRLEQGIAAAGGLTEAADVSRLYLAARLGNGERVVVPEKPSAHPSESALNPNPVSTGVPGNTAPAPASALININTATADELDALPGIGMVLAARIVAYRDTHGPFSSIDQLGEVEGIGPALLEKLRPLVTLGG